MISKLVTDSQVARDIGNLPILGFSFLSCWTMLKRDIAIGDMSICPSIRPSHVGNVSKLKTVELGGFFSPLGIPGTGTLVFSNKLSYTRSQGNTPSMALNETGVRKNSAKPQILDHTISGKKIVPGL